MEINNLKSMKKSKTIFYLTFPKIQFTIEIAYVRLIFGH